MRSTSMRSYVCTAILRNPTMRLSACASSSERFEDWHAGLVYEREKTARENASSVEVDEFIGFKLSVPIPLFDRKQGLLSAAQTRIQIATRRQEALRLQIDRELSSARTRVHILRDLLQMVQPDMLKRAEENVQLVDDSYRKGLLGIAELVQSRQQFIGLKSSYIDALKDYRIALIDLHAASGIFQGLIDFTAAGAP